MLTSFTIESIDIAKVYIRNTGQNALTGLSVYVNDELANFNVTPTSIAVGQIGTITIYSFIPDGATVKVTSMSGFSASKTADECSKAIGCWSFDELSGTTTYDSSPSKIDGTFVGGPARVDGKYGKAVYFRGTPQTDQVRIATNIPSSEYTIMFWYKLSTMPNQQPQYAGFIGKANSFTIEPMTSGTINYAISSSGSINSLAIANDMNWHLVVITRDGTTLKFFLDGILSNSNTNGIVTPNSNIMTLGFGWSNGFNGTIDEFRLYNKAIY
jgi:hypothetical protein